MLYFSIIGKQCKEQSNRADICVRLSIINLKVCIFLMIKSASKQNIYVRILNLRRSR